METNSSQPSLLVRVVIDHLRFAVTWNTTQPLCLGRALDNDVVLSRSSISGHHLRLEWKEDGGLTLEDLGSRNGCWIDGVRQEGCVDVLLGQRIFLGQRTHVVVMRTAAAVAAREEWSLLRIDGGLVGTLPNGHHELSALIKDAGSELGTLVLSAEQSPRLIVGSVSVTLQQGEPFEVANRYYFLNRETHATATVTGAMATQRARWQLEVRNAYTIPSVCVTDTQTGSRCVFRPSHAATLLMLLAERSMECAPKPGWVADDDLRVGLWGRAGLLRERNNLNVVIYRIRGRLRQAGMAPSLIGKEPQWTRLQQTQVAFVADSSSSRNAKTASDSVDG